MIEKIQASGLPALSAPFWFIEFFKVLGFILHMVPMNLWYAGVLLAVWLHYRGGEQGRRFGSRLMLQMPIIVAAGINLGIVPLLFLQVAYSRAFYPATILMAWFWLAIVVILIPAYYGVYAYSFGLRNSVLEMPAWQRYAGWLSAGLFVVIGFLFANGLSLTSRDPAAWRQIWLNHSVGGAATGTALNIGDVTFWPRWLLMFGLALITTAVWMIFDAFWIATRENEDYRRWVRSFATRLAFIGAIWATAAGGIYMLAILVWCPPDRVLFLSGWILPTLLTAASPWLPWALLQHVWRGELDRTKAAAVAGAQVLVLALNALMRQVVQNLELQRLFDPGVSAQPVATQWGPMILFLLVFVAGVATVGWILAQVGKASPSTVK